MKNLVINDLPMSKELDRKTLSTIAGGKTKVIFTFGKIVSMKRSQGTVRLPRPVGFRNLKMGF